MYSREGASAQEPSVFETEASDVFAGEAEYLSKLLESDACLMQHPQKGGSTELLGGVLGLCALVARHRDLGVSWKSNRQVGKPVDALQYSMTRRSFNSGSLCQSRKNCSIRCPLQFCASKGRS